MPASSKHHSGSSPKEIPSSHKHTKSKPIHIPGASTKSKVIIVLPPQMHPPALASSPSHRTAPNPQPVLISSSYPGRHRVGSMGSSSSSSSGATPPGVTFTVSSSSLPKTRPTFQRTGPSPSMSHQRPGHAPQGSSGSPGTSPSNPSHLSNTRVTVAGPTLPSGSIPVARATSVDTYTRSTITRGSTLEDEYYSHPAVRAYEMQKAVEQARWTRHRQMMNAQKQGLSGAQGRW